MIYNVKISDGNRDNIINLINERRKSGSFTVVDVGGSVEGWSASVVNAIVDFNDPIVKTDNIMHFKFDITHPDGWIKILEYVKINGKFDFCICTHTLEDIMNPGYVCEQISKISKEGYIAVPSKHCELSKFEAYYVFPNKFRQGDSVTTEFVGHRGYMHHRWIFTIHNNNFVGFPKIGYLDKADIFDRVADNNSEINDLSFFWKDSVSVEYINNNYLGPCSWNIVSFYDNLLDSEYV
jgi:hypothetical protein